MAPAWRTSWSACATASASADSAGTGLGAIKRQSDHFDVYSKPGLGTAIVCGVRTSGYRPPDLPGLELGAVCLPRIGEVVSGDALGRTRD